MNLRFPLSSGQRSFVVSSCVLFFFFVFLTSREKKERPVSVYSCYNISKNSNKLVSQMFHKYKSNCKWIKKHDMLFIKKLYIVIIVKSLVYAVITKQSTLSLSLLTEHPCQIHHSSLFMFYHPRRIR